MQNVKIKNSAKWEQPLSRSKKLTKKNVSISSVIVAGALAASTLNTHGATDDPYTVDIIGFHLGMAMNESVLFTLDTLKKGGEKTPPTPNTNNTPL
jgi:hypothetical protein